MIPPEVDEDSVGNGGSVEPVSTSPEDAPEEYTADEPVSTNELALVRE